MNPKLIFILSLFGFVMAFARYVIPFNIELMCYLPIFITYAYLVAKNARGKYFLYGFMISTLGCIWMTAANIMHDLVVSAHYSPNPYWPIIVLVFGIALGSFSLIASKIVKKRLA